MTSSYGLSLRKRKYLGPISSSSDRSPLCHPSILMFLAEEAVFGRSYQYFHLPICAGAVSITPVPKCLTTEHGVADEQPTILYRHALSKEVERGRFWTEEVMACNLIPVRAWRYSHSGFQQFVTEYCGPLQPTVRRPRRTQDPVPPLALQAS